MVALSRQRDPLPLPGQHTVLTRRLSRAVVRRLERRGHIDAWVADAKQSLNELAGHSAENSTQSGFPGVALMAEKNVFLKLCMTWGVLLMALRDWEPLKRSSRNIRTPGSR